MKQQGALLVLIYILPAAFGRLCVETIESMNLWFIVIPSRLRAAVC